jgi:hypothetical protein
MKLPRIVGDRWKQPEAPAPVAKKEDAVEVSPGVLCKQTLDLYVCERTRGHIGPHNAGTFLWSD